MVSFPVKFNLVILSWFSSYHDRSGADGLIKKTKIKSLDRDIDIKQKFFGLFLPQRTPFALFNP